jgi:hypothetical protein
VDLSAYRGQLIQLRFRLEAAGQPATVVTKTLVD